MIKIGLLGATGSIGRQTLDEIRMHKNEVCLSLVSAYSNGSFLEEIVNEFAPAIAVCPCISSKDFGKTKVYTDITALNNPEIYDDVDVVVNGIGGFAGLLPSVAVLKSRAGLATANKESVVSAGKFLTEIAQNNGKTIFPVDSEHSAIFQCLRGENGVKSLILTASGGAFRDYSRERLASVSANEALAHPTWKMGKKVTVDSATLMNKGLEIIEAKHLFGINSHIEVVVHRESVVHALVEFEDGFMKAILSNPDMRLPIRYAIFNGMRNGSGYDKHLNLADLAKLSFEKPDYERFPCLKIGEKVAENLDLGGILVIADEYAVNRFMKGEIAFYDIPGIINRALDRFSSFVPRSLDDVLGIEKQVLEYIG